MALKLGRGAGNGPFLRQMGIMGYLNCHCLLFVHPCVVIHPILFLGYLLFHLHRQESFLLNITGVETIRWREDKGTRYQVMRDRGTLQDEAEKVERYRKIGCNMTVK